MSRTDEPIDPFDVVPGGWSRRVTLRDGSPVLLRQIRSADRDRLAEGLSRLSPASRFLRFQRIVHELSDEELAHLTEVDHAHHEAIVALDHRHPERPGVGVARYIREPYEPEVAEAVITVADEYHGQGAGTMLLGALAARARANGIRVFRSYVMAGNAAMLEVFDHLGARRELETSGMWRVDLDVPEDESGLHDSPAGRAFLHAAKSERQMISLLPPIWSGRSRRRTSDRASATAAEPTGTAPEADVDDELADVDDELGAWLTRRGRR